MQYNFSKLKTDLAAAEEWLKKELAMIRTNRANPSILDSIRVEAYDSLMPVSGLASITNEDGRTMRVTPWDHDLLKAIEKSIITANLGVSVSIDDKGLRLSFPELTSDRRKEIVKMAKERLEHARIRIRKQRDEVITDIDNKEKSGDMGKDDGFRLKNETQKLIDTSMKKLEELIIKKEKEILS